MTGWAAHWDGIYSTRPSDGLSWHQDRAAVSLGLIEQSGVAHDGRIVDIGAGTSPLAAALLEDGYSSIALVDVSAAALELMRDRLPADSEVEFIVGDVSTVDLGPVDLWHDRAMFHFLVEPNDQARYVDAVFRHVRPGGHCVIATFAEDGPETCSGHPTRRYSVSELAQSFSPVFTLRASQREVHQTPDGRQQSFNYVLLSRES